MTSYRDRAGLKISVELHDFMSTEALPGLESKPDDFWAGVASIFAKFAPENEALLDKRDELQNKIDEFHIARQGQGISGTDYQNFLRDIGYLVPEPEAFSISTTNVDDALAQLAGPQLVVPVLNARYALNAANARWGSLYDALYGTDVIGFSGNEKPGYDPARGVKVIAMAKKFLDDVVPLKNASHTETKSYSIDDGALVPALRDASVFVGYRGDPSSPASILLRHNGMHIEIIIDRDHPIGRSDLAGVADIHLEAALSTIVDLEDSVAAVDAQDKVAAYRNWLGLMKGDLTTRFQKGGKSVERGLAADKRFTPPMGPLGTEKTLPGRALLLVRNVGHLMKNPSILLADGSEAPEGILDAIITSLIAMHDLNSDGPIKNSKTGSVYIVKPKMHGPAECAMSNRLFDAVEDMLNLPRHTIKIGVMDEERRTSANLAACIHAVRERIVFINTGFLDRTGDEMHTSMQAGPMIRKAEMKSSSWITAYEARNVAIGLACGLSGRAQIGKGMWAAPDRMGEMMDQKIGHPKTGANTAWVPSPTAATLHAMHYHHVDVFEVQKSVKEQGTPGLNALLTIPLATGTNWSPQEVQDELENNAQGILGYVVRWIDQGVGCSKVPDINDVGLMEDRATLRISSQHIANWLLHGVCTKQMVDDAFQQMAVRVDKQNENDPLYQPMAPSYDGVAYRAALSLVFDGVNQPSGYTEPLLHAYRRDAKQQQA